MLFNVENDTGDQISGYLVPDSFGGQSTLVVLSGERELLRIQTNELRQSLVAGRRHETGVCGFTLNADNLPGIASLQELILQDAETGVLIYRRTMEGDIKHRVVRLETHLFPIWELDAAIKQAFRYTYPRLERMGRELIEQIFHLRYVDSLYCSGRISLRPLGHLIDPQKQKLVTLIRNPHYELAERLLVLKSISDKADKLFGARDAIYYQGALEFAAELDLKDEKSLRRAFRHIPQSVATTLSNPLVRSLAAQTEEETLSNASVGVALDALAAFAVVGLRARADDFIESLVAELGLGDIEMPRIGESRIVAALGETLCKINAVSDLIDRDLEAYGHITKAFEKAL